MINQYNIKSLNEALNIIDSTNIIDNRFENSFVTLLKSLDLEEKWFGVEKLLSSSKPNIRAMGLRVVRRSFRERILLERVIQLSFRVERLAELQYWYTAILSRYSLTRFGWKLYKEIEKRVDSDFHSRTLEMHQVQNNKTKKIILDNLSELAIKHGF